LNLDPIRLVGAGLAIVAGILIFNAASQDEGGKCPGPNCPNNPAPAPGPAPTPQPQPRPRPCPRQEGAVGTPCRSSSCSISSLAWFPGASVGGPKAPDGAEIQCDLPTSLHLKNVGGSDGAGLCVFASASMAARFNNVPQLKDLMDWMRKYPGGGYPEKFDKIVAKKCAEMHAPIPAYIQVEGYHPEVLRAATKSGRMVCITYNHSPSGRYGGSRIAHMVCLPHLDEQRAAILDNNFPGTYEWLSIDEWKSTDPTWAVIYLNPAPPAPPRN
jgi:hypothetical protein